MREEQEVLALCRDCQIGYHAPFARFQRMAAHEDGPTFLNACANCGALWHETLRSARLVSPAEADRLYPQR